jgi:site-specific recombinase XerD
VAAALDILTERGARDLLFPPPPPSTASAGPDAATSALARIPCDPQLRARVHALLRLLWLTGCRISEALAVRLCDIDSHLGVVVMRNLKRRLKTATKAAPLPGEFITSLLALGSDLPDGQLFPWCRSRAFELVRDTLLAAGVDRPRAHPHALRHGHAVHALRSGAPLNIVQQALGHASVATTSIYLRVTGEDVRRAYAGITW